MSCTNRRENLQNADKGPFFFSFGDQHKIGEKHASVSVMTFFFGDHIETGQKRWENFHIECCSLERLHYFRHFCRRWKLRGNTDCRYLNFWERLLYGLHQSVFPIIAKKCDIVSGIFALKFCELRRFFSCLKPAFLFPAKNRRQLQRFTVPHSYMLHKASRKLAELRCMTFLFFFF